MAAGRWGGDKLSCEICRMDGGKKRRRRCFSTAKPHLKTNARFPFLNLEELQRSHVTGDGGGEGYAIISDINDIRGVIGSHLKALQITEERKTRATCADMRVFGLKRSRLCPIPDCFPTLSQTG